MGSKRLAIDLTEVERLAGRGLGGEEICLSLGINPEALARRKLISKRFHLAVRRGQIRANGEMADQLWKIAMNGSVTAAIFWLKRAGWKDVLEVESVPTEPQWTREEAIQNVRRIVKRLEEAEAAKRNRTGIQEGH